MFQLSTTLTFKSLVGYRSRLGGGERQAAFIRIVDYGFAAAHTQTYARMEIICRKFAPLSLTASLPSFCSSMMFYPKFRLKTKVLSKSMQDHANHVSQKHKINLHFLPCLRYSSDCLVNLWLGSPCVIVKEHQFKEHSTPFLNLNFRLFISSKLTISTYRINTLVDLIKLAGESQVF